MAKVTQTKDAAESATSLPPQDQAAAPVTNETAPSPADNGQSTAETSTPPASDLAPSNLQSDAEAAAHANAEAKRIADEAASNQGDEDDDEEDEFEGNVKKFVESLTDEQADILFAELSSRRGSKATGKGKKSFKVVTPFRDSENFAKEFKEGEDVSHLPKDRLKRLVELSLIEQK